MFKRITVLMLVTLIATGLAVTPAARAQTTWYVDDDAPNDPGPGDPNVSDPDEDGSPEHPFDAIQEGITAATDADTVLALDGTYTGYGNRDLDFNGKAIAVRSANGPQTCVIDCAGDGYEEHRRFYFYSGETDQSMAEGLTITNGYADLGAGIRCDESSPIIDNCVITGNQAEGFSYGAAGGGMYNLNSSPRVLNCTFSDNWATGAGRDVTGGAISGWGGAPVVSGCMFRDNSATCTSYGDYGRGGAVYIEHQDGATFADCIFENNYTDTFGGGMYLTGSDATLDNCTFVNNAVGNAEMGCGGGLHTYSSDPVLISCVFEGNAGGYAGGGLSNNWQSQPMLVNCTFRHNSAQWGGGMENYGSHHYTTPATLINCKFANNSAAWGGGMLNWGGSVGSNARLIGCRFSANVATERGGGLYNLCMRTPPTVLINCTLSGNTAAQGGGLANGNYTSATLANCLIAGNNASQNGGGVFCFYSASCSMGGCTITGNTASNGRTLACDSDDQQHPSDVEVANSIMWNGGDEIWNNDDSTITITYSDVYGDWPGDGNIDADPLFVDPDGPDDDPNTWEDNDYRLSAGSPCIDAADNEAVPADELDLDEDGDTDEPIPFDLDGYPRFVDDPDTDDTGNPDPDYPDLPIVDMGAYEFQVCAGDIDGDGDTDHADLGTLLGAWGSQPGDPNWNENADLDGDGQIGHGDLGVFLPDWGCGT